MIGPNAVLQLFEALEEVGGPSLRNAFRTELHLPARTDFTRMIPESMAAKAHRHLRNRYPESAEQVAGLAGEKTANYILANRIPRLAQALLKTLPTGIAAPLLAMAISNHAWTFAGSGSFAIVRFRPLIFSITGNPLTAGDTAEDPVCAWHAAVFQRLFRILVDHRYTVHETQCSAMGATCCQFEIFKEMSSEPAPGPARTAAQAKHLPQSAKK
ncbi:bacteriochlorophyll 4-vinyl reductase [Roseibium sp. RKSG952]|uniref:bacteriochlorophyll 4-vinyl reductase n=1 Tax=Roseibium sp. RKSG952 TaxID=2529384 RepID=UPI001AD91026